MRAYRKMKALVREMLMQRKHLDGADMFELKFIDIISQKVIILNKATKYKKNKKILEYTALSCPN